MAYRVGVHQTVGMSGLLGGFQEERAFLDATIDRIVPADHPARVALDQVAQTVAHNAQWPWAYKVRALEIAAHTLRGVEKRRAAAASASSESAGR